VRGAQGKLRQRGVFLIFRQLRIELKFFLGQLSFFLESAHQLLLSKIALILAMVRKFLGLSQLSLNSPEPFPSNARDGRK
jgi:hypothetical protein